MPMDFPRDAGINIDLKTFTDTGYVFIQHYGTPFYSLDIPRGDRDTHMKDKYPYCRYTVLNGKPHFCMHDFSQLLDTYDTGSKNGNMIRYGVVNRHDVILLDDPLMKKEIAKGRTYIWLGTENWLEKKIIQSVHYRRKDENNETLIPELEERIFREVLGKELRLAPAYKDLIPESFVNNPVAIDIMKVLEDRALKLEVNIRDLEADKASWVKVWEYIPMFLLETTGRKTEETKDYLLVAISGDFLSPIERRRIYWLLVDMEAPLKKKAKRTHFTRIETDKYRGIAIPKWLLPELPNMRAVVEEKIQKLDDKIGEAKREKELCQKQYEEYKIKKPWETDEGK